MYLSDLGELLPGLGAERAEVGLQQRQEARLAPLCRKHFLIRYSSLFLTLSLSHSPILLISYFPTRLQSLLSNCTPVKPARGHARNPPLLDHLPCIEFMSANIFPFSFLVSWNLIFKHNPKQSSHSHTQKGLCTRCWNPCYIWWYGCYSISNRFLFYLHTSMIRFIKSSFSFTLMTL